MEDGNGWIEKHKYYQEYRRLKTRIALIEANCARMVRARRDPRDIYAARQDLDQAYERFHDLEHLLIRWTARA